MHGDGIDARTSDEVDCYDESGPLPTLLPILLDISLEVCRSVCLCQLRIED